MVDGTVVRSLIPPIWLGRQLWCEPIRCHCRRALFSSPNRALWLFCPSPGIRCRSHLLNSRKRRPTPLRTTGQSPFSSELVRRVESNASTVHWSLVSTSVSNVSSTFTKRRRNPFGLRLNSIKHCCEVVSQLRLLSEVSNRGTYRTDSFPMPKISCRI